MANNSSVPKLYQSVVDDVISNVREYFLDDGIDEQVLIELKQLWESKLVASKVVQAPEPPPTIPIPPQPAQPQPQQKPQPQPAPHQPQPQQRIVTHQPTTQTLAPAALPVINQSSQGLVEMSGPAQTATLALPAQLYQQQLASLQGTITLTQGGQHYIIQTAPNQQLVQAAAAQTAASTTASPTVFSAASQNASVDPALQRIVQLDGAGAANESSSDDDDDDEEADDKDDDDDDQNDEDGDEQGEEEESLNSNDDVSSEEDPSEVFDTESVVVCQFDKINRNKNKWKFHLKDGIMNLNGRDYVFQKGTGEAEW